VRTFGIVSWNTGRSLGRQPFQLLLVGLSVGLVTSSGIATAGTWQAQGPGPATEGQVENVIPDNEVVGAVHTVVAHPSNADILYIGGVNGGIWKTTNATSATVNWTRLTDDQQSLSIGAMELDPTDGTNQTLVAGIGGFSSFGARGALTGLLRTTNGGASWSAIDGGGELVGRNISGVAPRGSTMVISVNTADPYSYDEFGIFRSTDGGASFVQVSSGDGSATGLPGGVAYDLASDPTNLARLYTSVIFAGSVGGSNGVYRSTDTGATWTKVSSPAMDALITDSVSNIEIAVGSSGQVFVAIVEFGRLTGVFHTLDQGANWTQMALPTTVEDGVSVGIHPGGQGSIHLSIAADPTDEYYVYIGGDRQPYLSEFSGGGSFFPNSIGAMDYSGRLFLGDALNPSDPWVPLTHSGTDSGSAPHADSREMTFDANGDLIETDDGGIYKRTFIGPFPGGDWFSLIGDLQTTEYHSVAYDTVANVVFGGAQDTGTTVQNLPGFPEFTSVLTADGGVVAAADSSGGTSTRYASTQFLGNFSRLVYDSSNVLQSVTFPALSGSVLFVQFYTPIAANRIDDSRLVIGGSSTLVESFDQGDTISLVSSATVNSSAGNPIEYGVPGNADLLMVGSGSSVLLRSTAQGALAPTNYQGGTVLDVSIDPDTPTWLFAVDSNQVFLSSNSGGLWSDVTGDLLSFDPGTARTLAFIPSTDDGLVVGTDRGVFVARASSGFSTWERLGTGLPNAPVYSLDYDRTDDVLTAGLVGRGAYLLALPLTGGPIFADGFELGTTTAWSDTVQGGR
jgi:hypothetical protein